MRLTRLLRRAATAFTVSTALLTAVVVTAAPARAADTGDEAAFVAGINQVRASRRLPALTVNGQLTGVARAWALHMAIMGSLSHNPNLSAQAPGGWMVIAENVGMGPPANSIQAGFASSPPHYANMTNSQVTQVGVGVLSSNGTLWVVEDFWGGGFPAGAAPRPPPPPAVVIPRPPPPPITYAAPVATPVVAPPPTTPPVTTPPAPPVNLDSAAQQIQYFDAWD